MKTFLLIFIFALFLKADSSYQSKCVKDFYLTSTGTSTTQSIHLIFIKYSQSPLVYNQYTYSTSIISELVNNIDKFTYDSTTSRCIPILNQPYQVLLSSLTGILIGFTILFFSIFLTIKVGSRK